MVIQLMKLRQVPEDELIDILKLLDELEVDYYQTSAGAFGISLPALWLRDETRHAEVLAQLEDYAAKRQQRARLERDAWAELNGHRTMSDIFRDHPLKFCLRVVVIVVLLFITVKPFLNF